MKQARCPHNFEFALNIFLKFDSIKNIQQLVQNHFIVFTETNPISDKWVNILLAVESFFIRSLFKGLSPLFFGKPDQFWDFLKTSLGPKSQVIWHLVRQLLNSFSDDNNLFLFHWWWRGIMLKGEKVLKYFLAGFRRAKSACSKNYCNWTNFDLSSKNFSQLVLYTVESFFSYLIGIWSRSCRKKYSVFTGNSWCS